MSLLIEKIKNFFEVYEFVLGSAFSWHRFILTGQAKVGNIIPQPFPTKILCLLDLPYNRDKSPP